MNNGPVIHNGGTLSPALPRSTRRGRAILGLAIAMAVSTLVGCSSYPQMIEPDIRRPIDRSIIETPANYYIKLAVRNLTAPTAMAWVREEGEYKDTFLVAESGGDGREPRITGFRKRDGAELQIYPHGPKLPTFGLIHPKQQIFGPIGGMCVANGRIYLTHKNAEGKGCISSLTFDGQVTVLQDDLPSQGDFGLTDIAVHPTTGRIWFCQGSATNSGVVGPDNFQTGWARKFESFCDSVPQNIKLLGLKFFTKNPQKSWFGGDDNVGTGPYQPFGTNNQLRIHADPLGKPTSAIYSIAPTGGDIKVEAWGIHNPRGLGFDEYSNAYAINDGMEMRGTRPVANDPDSLVKIAPGAWYGFPDFTTDLNPVSNTEYQPPQDMIESSGGYPEVAALIDRNASGLPDPSVYKSSLYWGSVAASSGAAKFDFTPGTTFREFPNSAIVALSGDRAPFSTSGQPVSGPVGYKLVRFDMQTRHVEDFVRNTKQMPGSKIGEPQALERPIDVKFGPDGRCYILDFGKMEMRGGKPQITRGTGRIFVLEPMPAAASK